MKDSRKLSDLAGVGPATLKDFQKLGVTSIEQLRGADPVEMYERMEQLTGTRHDICLLDVFRAAVAQAQDPELPEEQRQWWYWSRLRKHGQA